MNDVEDRIKTSFEPIHLSTEVTAIRAAGQRRRHIQAASFVMAALSLALVVGIVTPAVLPFGHKPSAASEKKSSAVSATLYRLSKVAAAQPVVTVGLGQYVYSEIRGRSQTCQGDVCSYQPTEEQTWTAPDGSGRFAGSRGSDRYSEIARPGELNADDLTKVPTNLDALRSFIRERAAKADQPLDYEMFIVVGDLLRESFSSPVLFESPELRSALFEVVSTLPGVELVGATTDGIGRPGIAVGYAEQGVRHELIFDPRTSAILGERDVKMGSGTTVPGSWAAYVESGVVNSTNALP